MCRNRVLATILLVLLAGGTAWAADGEAQERRAWADLAARRFREAEASFLGIVRAAPERAEAWAGLGVARAQLRNYTEALTALLHARAAGARYPRLDLEIGRTHYFLREWAAAIPPLREYARRHPQEAAPFQILGLCFFRLGDYRRTIAAFSHPRLRQSPQHGALALYHLAAAFAALGDRQRAQSHIEELRRKHPDSPYARSAAGILPTPEQEARARAAAEEAAEDVWAARRRERPARPWFLSVGSGIAYDTNPLSLGDDPLVGDSLAGRQAVVFGAHAGGGVRLLNQPDSSWVVEATERITRHDDLDEFDAEETAVRSVAEHWLDPRVGLVGSAGFSHLRVDRERASDAWSLGLGCYLVEADWTRTLLSVGSASRQFYLEGLLDAQDPDGLLTTVSLRQEAVLPGTGWGLALGAWYGVQRTAGRDYDADFHGVTLQAGHPLPWEIRATVALSWTHGDYRHGNSRDAEGRARDDDLWTGSLRLDRPLNAWLRTYVETRYADSWSNIPDFDYERGFYVGGFEIVY